jgi:hypothetical protein
MAVVETIKIEGDASGAVTAFNKTTDAAKKTGTAAKESNQAIESGLSAIDKKTGGAVSAFRALTGGLKSAVSGFKTLRGAVIATGIGALLIAITSLVSYFTRTERGAQKLRVIMAGLGAAVNAVLDVVTSLGDALTKLFSGDFSGAIDTVKKGFAGIGDEIRNDVKAAIELEEAMNRVKVQERELTSERSRANKEIIKARLIADDITKSTEERAAAIREAGRIEEEISNRELATQRERLRVLEQQASLSESDEATLDEIENARARVYDLEAANLSRRKRLQTEIIALRNEELAIEKELQKAREEGLKAAVARGQEALKKSVDAQVGVMEKGQQNVSNRIQKTNQAITTSSTQAVQTQAATLEDYVNFAVANLDVVSGALGNLSYAVGQNTKMGKALSIAQAIIDTYTAANTALKSAPPPFNFVAAAGVTAAGIANVNAIKNTQVPTSASSSVSIPSISQPSASPQFNLIGQGGVNQLAQSIGSQFNRPMRAYVVGSDINSSQELERKRIKIATFG